MKKLSLPVALLLAGCAGSSPPPPTPTPADIQELSAVVAAIDTRPGDYYTFGTALAARNCVGWFSAQIVASSKNSALSSELGILGTVAGVAGGPAGAAAAAAMGFGVSTLSNIQANASAGIDPAVTYGLVRKVQQAWLAAAPLPITKADAYMLVEDFAEKCQLPEIKKAIADAVTTAPVRAVTTAAPFGLSASAYRPMTPPMIVIGEPR